jgi:hypothetical protein
MPTTRESLNEIFNVNGSRLNNRESTVLELKESFNWGNRDQYIKTMASFANNKGGYLVFGVQDSPHEIVGFNNVRFNNFDEAKITGFLNECFAPEIRWKKFTYSISELDTILGIIYTFPAQRKPIICKKNHGKIKEGAIYYRYNARSEIIKFPELKSIFEEEREKFQEKLFDQLGKILDIGVHDSAILDTYEGKIHGNNSTMIIDDSLIPKLKFINEGSFSETDGEPTLKLIGSVQGKEVVTKDKYTSIRTPDIIYSFLDHELPIGIEPEEIIRQLPYEGSAYLPVYYFIKKADLTIQEAIELLENSRSSGSTKSKLIERLQKDDKVKSMGSLSASTAQSKLRNKYLDKLRSKKLSKEDLELEDSYDLKYIMESITHLNQKEIEVRLSYIQNLLKELYKKKNEMSNGVYGTFRKTLSYVDKKLYR